MCLAFPVPSSEEIRRGFAGAPGLEFTSILAVGTFVPVCRAPVG